jgi:hypothetical protein
MVDKRNSFKVLQLYEGADSRGQVICNRQVGKGCYECSKVCYDTADVGGASHTWLVSGVPARL